jgi:hypothetical protein
LLASLFVAAPTAAQQPGAPSDSVSTQGAPSERSPLVAGLLQAALPPLPIGYLYAGSFARGLIPTGLMLVGTSVFLIETVELIDWTDEDGSGSLMWLGLGMTLGGYVFGIVDAANVTRNRNARVRAVATAFRVLPAPSGVGIAVTIPVG